MRAGAGWAARPQECCRDRRGGQAGSQTGRTAPEGGAATRAGECAPFLHGSELIFKLKIQFLQASAQSCFAYFYFLLEQVGIRTISG